MKMKAKDDLIEQIEAENKITISNKTLEDIEKIFSEAHEAAKKETSLADVLDCFDYWIPELIRRVRNKDQEIEVLREGLRFVCNQYKIQTGNPHTDKQEMVFKCCESLEKADKIGVSE